MLFRSVRRPTLVPVLVAVIAVITALLSAGPSAHGVAGETDRTDPAPGTSRDDSRPCSTRVRRPVGDRSGGLASASGSGSLRRTPNSSVLVEIRTSDTSSATQRNVRAAAWFHPLCPRALLRASPRPSHSTGCARWPPRAGSSTSGR